MSTGGVFKREIISMINQHTTGFAPDVKHKGADIKGIDDKIRDFTKGLNPGEKREALKSLARRVEKCELKVTAEDFEKAITESQAASTETKPQQAASEKPQQTASTEAKPQQTTSTEAKPQQATSTEAKPQQAASTELGRIHSQMGKIEFLPPQSPRVELVQTSQVTSPKLPQETPQKKPIAETKTPEKSPEINKEAAAQKREAFGAKKELNSFAEKLQYKKEGVNKESLPPALQPITAEINQVITSNLTAKQKEQVLKDIGSEIMQGKEFTPESFKNVAQKKIGEAINSISNEDLKIKEMLQKSQVEQGSFLQGMSETDIRSQVTNMSNNEIKVVLEMECQTERNTLNDSGRTAQSERLEIVFNSMTKEQVASLKTSDNLWRLIAAYPHAAAKGLPAESLGVLATNYAELDKLARVIDKFPSDNALFDKLNAVAPHMIAVEQLDRAFNGKLEALKKFDWEYKGHNATVEEKTQAIEILKGKMKEIREKRAEQLKGKTFQPKIEQKKEFNFQVGGKGKTQEALKAEMKVEKRAWSNDELNDFVTSLKTTGNEDECLKNLQAMDEEALKKLTTMLDKKGLDRLWTVETKMLGGLDLLEARTFRVGIFLENLSLEQVELSAKITNAEEVPTIFRVIQDNPMEASLHLSPGNLQKMVDSVKIGDPGMNQGKIHYETANYLNEMVRKMDRETPQLAEKLKILAPLKNTKSPKINTDHIMKASIESKRMYVKSSEDKNSINQLLK